jgi:cobalt-zinc-cadmium efflux system protein
VDGVSEVHDLHVWTITSGMTALSVHLLAAPEADRERDSLLVRAQELLRHRFGITHTTIQVEGPCGCQPCEAGASGPSVHAERQ